MEITVKYKITTTSAGISRLVYQVVSVTDSVIDPALAKYLFLYRKPDGVSGAVSVDAGSVPGIRTLETFQAYLAPLFGTTVPVLWDALPAVTEVLDPEDETADALFPTDTALGSHVFDRLVRSDVMIFEGDIPTINKLVTWLDESMAALKAAYNTYRNISTVLRSVTGGWVDENVGA